MRNIVCFGELLLRFSPEAEGKWTENQNMAVYIGGAELNVATALSLWGLPVKYLTALPNNYLSHEICESLRLKKIDTSAILFSGNRIGIYYLPQSGDLKHAGVIYDRSHSSFSELKTGLIDWDEILKDASWFHLSAISPALSKNLADVCLEGLKIAAKKNITVSVDLNYRSRLWKYGSEPASVMRELAKYCHHIMGNIWSASSLLGTPLDENIHHKKSKTAYLTHARQTSLDILNAYPVCKTVANTFRFDEGRGLKYYSTLDTKGEQFVSQEFSTTEVVDRVGTGDCFMAGLIYSNYHNYSLQQSVNFAASAAFGKFREKGDSTSQNVESILSRLINYA